MKERFFNKTVLIVVLICSYSNAQTSDFIVTTSQDTMYVDAINLTDFEVKTKTANKKKKYYKDEIISYYKLTENKHYERITLEKKERKEPDRYDYRRNEDSYLEEYNNRIKYKYIQRLTAGKVKLFTEVINEPAYGIPGQVGYVMPHKNELYYISIDDAKLELINTSTELQLFNYSEGLKLTREVYDILKIYLYRNDEINARLDKMFKSKPVAKEQAIIDLINEYNLWVKLDK